MVTGRRKRTRRRWGGGVASRERTYERELNVFHSVEFRKHFPLTNENFLRSRAAMLFSAKERSTGHHLRPLDRSRSRLRAGDPSASPLEATRRGGATSAYLNIVADEARRSWRRGTGSERFAPLCGRLRLETRTAVRHADGVAATRSEVERTAADPRPVFGYTPVDCMLARLELSACRRLERDG